MFQKTVWSPVEIEFLKKNRNLPLDQLTIALSKSRNAIKIKCAELDGKPSQQKSNIVRTKIGKRQDLNGLFLRSGWEANFIRYINYVAKDSISLIEYEPTTFSFIQFGIKRGAIAYTPDFKLTFHDSSYLWIEIKGMIKAEDRAKIRRFQKYFPTEFVCLKAVVGSEKTKAAQFFDKMCVPILFYYNEINQKFRKVIPNWE